MFKETFRIFKAAAKGWQQDNAMRLSAALAYYSVFSLAPILLISIAIAGIIFGEDAARGAIEAELRGSIGQDSAAAVEEMIDNARKSGSNRFMAVLGTLILIFSATGVFAQLKEAMNIVWGIEPHPKRAWVAMIKARFLSLSIVLAVGFMLLTSLVLSAVLSATTAWLGTVFSVPGEFIHFLGFSFSLGIITLLFAMIFKILPDAELGWKDVWVGAFLTAVLFSIGKFLLALYLGREETASTYGAAGAFILLLLWVYYTANILLFGAEFTQAYVRSRGRIIVASKGCVRIDRSES